MPTSHGPIHTACEILDRASVFLKKAPAKNSPNPTMSRMSSFQMMSQPLQ